MHVTVETVVKAPLDKVWKYWNEPEHVTQWCFAQDDWEAPSAETDLRVGGKFRVAMAAKDKSAGFDFGGTYTEVREESLVAYEMGDGRRVTVWFAATPEGVKVTETFETENENSAEKQRAGWQAIMDNFKKHAESQAGA